MDVAPFQPIDRISNLPDNVMDNILVRLTMRDAAKTSVLGKQWRYKWHNLPQLIFDDTVWPKSEKNEELAKLKFVKILYQVLLCHQGPITDFSLIIPELTCSENPEIDHLIYILSKSNVEDLTLIMSQLAEYKLPSTICRCVHLKYLSLSYCEINPLRSFKGFRRLISLSLEFVIIEAGVLADWISSCPLLEHLSLHLLSEPDHLEIDAPMLKFFYLSCDTISICVKNSPLLELVSISCNEDCDFRDGIRNFVDFFDSLPALQDLHLEGFFLEPLRKDEVQTKITASIKNLKTLKLSTIVLDYLHHVSVILFLMRSCSNIKELEIEIETTGDDDEGQCVKAFLEEQDCSNVLLPHLEEVKLEDFQATVTEIALVKLLFENSPSLKRMVIISSSPSKFDKKLVGTLKEMSKSWFASPNVEVTRNQTKMVFTRS